MILRHSVICWSITAMLVSGSVMAMIKSSHAIPTTASAASEPEIVEYHEDHILNSTKIVRSLLLKELTIGSKKYKKVMMEVCRSEDPDLQESIYTFLTNPVFNSENKVEAKAILESGLEQKRAWAYWVKAQQEPKDSSITKWHCLAANQGYVKATKYIEEHKDEIRNASGFLKEIKSIKNKKEIKGKWEEQQKQWTDLCYAQPFIDLYRYHDNLPKELMVYIEKALLINKAVEFGSGDPISIETMFRFAREFYVKGDKRKYFRYCIRAARLGNELAMFQAGFLLQNGFEGQVPDKKRALELYLLAAKKGELEAMYNAGFLLQDGFEGQEPDKKKALWWYLQAAEKGAPEAMFDAGFLLLKGFEGQASDKKEALKLLLRAAEKGMPEAMFNAGNLLQEGFEGQEPNKKRALELYLQAAEKGVPEAMFDAGFLLQDGFEGQASDKKKALELFLCAAGKGLPEGMHGAGFLLQNGFEGQEPDKKRALGLYLQAAEKGMPAAMFNAGNLLICGQSSDEYKALGIHYLVKAAEIMDAKVSVRSMIALEMFYLGNYGEKYINIKSALFWLQKAASFDNDNADVKSMLEHTKKFSLEEPGAGSEKTLEDIIERAEQPLLASASETETGIPNKLRIKGEEAAVKAAGAASADSEEELVTELGTPAEVAAGAAQASALVVTHESRKERLNAKGLRAKLRTLGEAEEKLMKEALVKGDLLENSKITVGKIFGDTATTATITSYFDWKELTELFEDPFFKSQVSITKTKSGCMISATNLANGKYATASTHNKHTKGYKGLHPAFIRDLQKILSLFDIYKP